MLDEATLATHLSPDLLRRMVAAFYRRIKEDDLIGPMYPPEDWEGGEKRLRDFLNFRFLGDPTYMAERGHPRLRMRHMPFSIGKPERDRWLKLMAGAMEEQPDLHIDAKKTLAAFFFQVADHMRNQMETGGSGAQPTG
jgi:hemoglobin